MKTQADIRYHHVFAIDVVIPKGTSVIPANNLPMTGRYWAEPWPGMSEEAQSWHRNYGFLLELEEVSGTL